LHNIRHLQDQKADHRAHEICLSLQAARIPSLGQPHCCFLASGAYCLP
jgi:hypothetical protein